jgi:hypothetical protein
MGLETIPRKPGWCIEQRLGGVVMVSSEQRLSATSWRIILQFLE